MKKRIIILGSTGSIGTSALDVLDGLSDEWEVVGLAAHHSLGKLAKQVLRYHPEAVALSGANGDVDVRDTLEGDSRVFTGPDAMVELVENVDCDCVLAAVVGSAGLPATKRAIELGKRIALANKEALVVAGSVLVPLAHETKALILPVDSEHSAVFQALQCGRREDVRCVYLTASGGPFRTHSAAELNEVSVQSALDHPTWDMGPKVTIDSATMMNKALEIVEARWLFDLAPDQIRVIVHPESIIHSLVEFRDGSIMAQMSPPDMRTPIQYALTWPDRSDCPSRDLDWSRKLSLNFEPPDESRFPALRLGHEVARRGGTSGAVLNAANEAAVALFLDGEIGYTDIARLTEETLRNHEFVQTPTIEQLLEADRWARQEVTRCMAC